MIIALASPRIAPPPPLMRAWRDSDGSCPKLRRGRGEVLASRKPISPVCGAGF